MTLVLDTSVLIGEAPVGLEEQVAVSVVSFAELQYGLLAATDPAERGLRLARLSAIEQTFDPLPVTGAVARSYAVLASTIHRTGRRPRSRALDLLIAATAHAAGAGSRPGTPVTSTASMSSCGSWSSAERPGSRCRPVPVPPGSGPGRLPGGAADLATAGGAGPGVS